MSAANGNAQYEGQEPGWLFRASDLLDEPDPGPTPWLVENLITDVALVALVGRWKTTKSYGLLELLMSVATGEPAFGHLAVPVPGPVVYVCEESGRRALWRRLDALCRGRAIDLAARWGVQLRQGPARSGRRGQPWLPVGALPRRQRAQRPH